MLSAIRKALKSRVGGVAEYVFVVGAAVAIAAAVMTTLGNKVKTAGTTIGDQIDDQVTLK